MAIAGFTGKSFFAKAGSVKPPESQFKSAEFFAPILKVSLALSLLRLSKRKLRRTNLLHQGIDTGCCLCRVSGTRALSTPNRKAWRTRQARANK